MRQKDSGTYFWHQNSSRIPILLVIATLVTGMIAGLISQNAGATVFTTPLDWRSTTLEAGFDRLKEQFLDLSIRNDTEFVGAVLQAADGHYEFTHGQGKPGQDKVTFRIQRPSDTRIVALWHTHGNHGPSRAVFSRTDAELVRQTGLPFYLITPDGEVRVLRPTHLERRHSRIRVRGTMARLPRGSHPGERVMGRSQKRQPLQGCADVIEV